jgi:hypothetical protein
MTRLIGVLPGWGALKTSPVSGGGHDHGLTANYELVLDEKRLASSGTDTCSYLASGAFWVGWLIARPPLSAAAKATVLSAVSGLPGLLIEGGSLADGFSPDRRYLVVPPGSVAIKPETFTRARLDGVIVLRTASYDSPEVAALLADVTAWARR